MLYLLGGSFIGGIVGALGLGGGVVFNPLLIGLEVPAQVATSTAMYMILFSSLASSVIFLTMGGLNVDFALWIGAWSVIGIAFCMKVVNKLIQKYRRPSIIVFLLAIVLLISMIMIPIFNGMQLYDLAKGGVDIYVFDKMC